jgi:hypothetical protein
MAAHRTKSRNSLPSKVNSLGSSAVLEESDPETGARLRLDLRKPEQSPYFLLTSALSGFIVVLDRWDFCPLGGKHKIDMSRLKTGDVRFTLALLPPRLLCLLDASTPDLP